MRQADVIIIGQGPAGLSAAIYAARAGISTLILGCEPKIAGDYDIDNYFAFPRRSPAGSSSLAASARPPGSAR
jgi:thioredoxin reductase (NADPH)